MPHARCPGVKKRPAASPKRNCRDAAGLSMGRRLDQIKKGIRAGKYVREEGGTKTQTGGFIGVDKLVELP